jgi:metal-responsive CopG/Arc/MetJ family transcriptional regulator
MAAHKKPEAEKMIRTLVTLDKETRKAWVRAAKKEKKNASEWIRMIVKKAVEEKEHGN